MSYLWNVFLYKPLVNALAFFVSVIPGGDVGFAVILLTILVKLILFPLSQKAIKNQFAMNLMAPELDRIKKSGASKEEQARLTFELYKKHKTNPFSGCLLQIPVIFVIIALYKVFITGVDFNSSLLYPFIHAPEHVNMLFLGLVDLSKSSVVLAVLAGLSQYFQAYYMPKPNKVSNSSKGSFGDSFAQSMNMQMKYILPLMIFFFGLKFSGAVALYWIISNIFTIGQQIYVNKTEQTVLEAEIKVLSS